MAKERINLFWLSCITKPASSGEAGKGSRRMKEINIVTLKQFYNTDEKFRRFIDRNMKMYQKSLEEELSNPIAVEYYKTVIPGGCNYRGTQCDSV